MDNRPMSKDFHLVTGGLDNNISQDKLNHLRNQQGFPLSSFGSFSALFDSMPGSLLLFKTTDKGKSYQVVYPAEEVQKEYENYLINLILGENGNFDIIREKLKKAYGGSIEEKHIIKIIRNRKEYWIEIYLAKISDKEILGFLKDVSELNHLIEAFEINKQNLVQLQENVPIGLFQTDAEGKFDFGNKWLLKILGYRSLQEIKEVRLKDLFQDKNEYDDFIRKINNKGRIKETEVKFRHPVKGYIWITISIQGIYDSKEKIETIDGFIYDITERKAALQKLRENEQMFRAISQNIKSAIYIFDDSGEFIYCNPAATEITGYPKTQLLKMRFYDIIHPEYRDKVKKRGLKRVEGKSVPKSYEFKIQTGQNEEKWIEINATRLILQEKSVVLGLANDITERKQFLDTLKSSEEKYKSLYYFFRLMADNVPDMIWAKNLDNEFIFANKAMTDRILNARDVEEPIGKTQDFFAEREKMRHPEKKDWYTFGDLNPNSDKIVLEKKKYQTFNEFGYICGEYFHLDVHKAPLVDENGKIIGTVGSARDVTKQKKLEEERKRDENIRHVVYKISNAINTTKDLNELLTVIRLELSHVINTKNLFIALYDKDTDRLEIPYFVDEKDRFLDIPPGKTLTHYLIRKNKPLLLHRHEIEELARKKEINLTGSMAKVWLGVPLNINDETIGALVLQNYKDENAFTYRDLELIQFVSSQISVTINQKQAEDALRISEFALRQIIDTVPVMIFAKDKNMRFVLANHSFANIYQSRVEDIEGKLQSEIHPVKHEVDKYEKDDQLLLSGKTNRIETEESFTTIKGKKRILKTVKVPFKSITNKAISVLGVAMDITGIKQTEIELKNARDKAEESDRLKTAFLANMSHEIRTPMNAIIGFSELLNDPDLTAENRKEFISLIGDNSKVLLNLIEDIIDVAKIEARQVKIVESTCQVNQILSELKDNYEKQLHKYSHKDIDVRIKCADDSKDFAIKTDPLRFKQVMNNLLSNAVKFTEKGYIEYGFSFDDNQDNITFYVKDTGIGLAKDKTKFIFERFRQGEESSTKEYGGTGLGLTISKRLVEMLGGELWVESELNKGSTFFFSLPNRPISNGPQTKQKQVKTGKHDWSGKTILVAEDEISNFELIKATLFRTRVNILHAANGVEAVKVCSERNGIDLILMDIRMPEMNGYEATRRIKAKNKNIPVISLTAYAMSDDREKSFKAGCDEYISKPFNPTELIDLINKYI